MNPLRELSDRRYQLGLSDPKYAFLHAPFGFPITHADKSELEAIGRTAHAFLARVNDWLPSQIRPGGGTWWGSLLQKGLPANYANLPYRPEMPQTLMIDTVWTDDGWRIVEIDTTNRNGLGFPLMLRDLYDLPNLWLGTAQSWQRDGWNEPTQVMSHRHRFYEPYYCRFLKEVSGRLILQNEIDDWLARVDSTVKLVDLPVIQAIDEHDHHAHELVARLLTTVGHLPIAIPPKHQLSSKAVLALPWEVDEFRSDPVKCLSPEARLVCRSRELPKNPYFLKMLQSGGAHGVFLNDNARLASLLPMRRPEAVWQRALPIRKRMVPYLDQYGVLRDDPFFIRLSIYVDQTGEMVDADVTASQAHVVHGGHQSIMTVPVLSS